MKKKKKVKHHKKAKIEVSAGGIVYNRRRGKVKVVLVGRLKPFISWRLPKGHPLKNESLLEAAKREVHEEAGVHGKGGPKIGKTNYYFTHPVTKKFIHKFVYYYLLKKESGSVMHHDREYDLAKWFTLDQAIEKASFKDDKKILKIAKVMINKRKMIGQHNNSKGSTPS